MVLSRQFFFSPGIRISVWQLVNLITAKVLSNRMDPEVVSGINHVGFKTMASLTADDIAYQINLAISKNELEVLDNRDDPEDLDDQQVFVRCRDAADWLFSAGGMGIVPDEIAHCVTKEDGCGSFRTTRMISSLTAPERQSRCA